MNSRQPITWRMNPSAELIGTRPCAVFGLDGPGHPQRVEQAQVHLGREDRVVQDPLIGPHGILERAELGQAMLEEVGEAGLGVLGG